MPPETLVDNFETRRRIVLWFEERIGQCGVPPQPAPERSVHQAEMQPEELGRSAGSGQRSSRPQHAFDQVVHRQRARSACQEEDQDR